MIILKGTIKKSKNLVDFMLPAFDVIGCTNVKDNTSKAIREFFEGHLFAATKKKIKIKVVLKGSSFFIQSKDARELVSWLNDY